MSQPRTVHIRIEGRVQGVGFRYWLELAATAAGLTGWVRNRADRSVEAVLQGPPNDVADVLRRCEEGPPDADVTRVEIIGEGVGVYERFDLRPTV
jgi:acylphosphatase